MCRYINTGLKGQVALSVLNSVMGQLSDGIWENSPNMTSYWKDLRIANDNNFIVFVVQEHDRYDKYMKRYYKNYYRDMTDIEILKFWLRKIKAIFSVELKYYPDRGLKWSVDCKEVLRYYNDNLMVSDVFTVYTELKENIKKIEAKQVLLYRQKGL